MFVWAIVESDIGLAPQGDDDLLDFFGSQQLEIQGSAQDGVGVAVVERSVGIERVV